MKKKNIYFCDLDDTLVDDGSIIDAELAKEIDEVLKNENIEFVISSARSFNSIKERTKKIKKPIKISARSGSVLYDENGKIIFFIEILKDDLNKILQYFIDKKLCPVIISINNNSEKLFSISECVNDQFLERIRGMKIKLVNYSEINKINHIVGIYCFENIVEEKKYDIDNVKIRNYNDFIHITNINCNKGEAIKFLTQKYSYENIISFGNDENDFEMLDNSDVAYLVYKNKLKLNCKYNQIPFDNGKKIIEIMRGSE